MTRVNPCHPSGALGLEFVAFTILAPSYRKDKSKITNDHIRLSFVRTFVKPFFELEDFSKDPFLHFIGPRRTISWIDGIRIFI